MTKTVTISSFLIIEEAKKREWNTKIISEESNIFEVTPPDGERYLFNATLSKLNSGLGVTLAGNKNKTRVICEHFSIPYPDTLVFEPEEVSSFIDKHKKVVVKPAESDHGIGITTNITDTESLHRAYQNAKSASEGAILMQKQQEGLDHRFLVVGEKVIAVSLRRPPTAVGDGKLTIAQHIELLNRHEWRGEEHNSPLTFIDSRKVDEHITARGYSLKSVIEDGREMALLGVSNLSQGGEAVDFTAEAHPELKAMAVRLAKAMGLRVAGVDIISGDISKSLKEGSSAVIEVNSNPGIRMHHFPIKGTAVNAAAEILNLLDLRKG